MNPIIEFKNMKAIYPVNQRVSVWVGNFPTENDFEKCLDSDVTKRLGLSIHLHGTSEVAFKTDPVSIRQLIQGFSGSKTFVKEVEAKAAARGISTANAALVCYYVKCEDAPDEWGPFHFLGTFVGQDVR